MLPGSKYINITPDVSQSVYTAPANGYFTFSIKNSSAENVAYATGAIIPSDSEIALLRSQVWMPTIGSGNLARGFLPCKKGQRLYLGYYNAMIDFLQFTYAEEKQYIIKY